MAMKKPTKIRHMSTVPEIAKQLKKTEEEIRRACAKERIPLVDRPSDSGKPRPRKLSKSDVEKLRQHFNPE